MVETKVILCDLCKKKVATLKCALCGKDLCSDNCSSAYNIYFGSGGSNFAQFIFCENDCYKKVSGYILKLYQTDDKKELSKKIKELVLDYVKKGLILDGLKDEKK